MSNMFQIATITMALAFLIGCAPFSSSNSFSSFQGRGPVELSALPQGGAQLQTFCSRSGGDRVHELFCSGKALPKSLRDLESGLGVAPTSGASANFALTGHSSSLLRGSVSAINPRAVLFTGGTSDFVALSYTRGEEFVEIAAGDPKTHDKSFFLVTFQHPCDAGGSCGPADLLTPKVESQWNNISVYSDEDLKNTTLDCRQCHQTGGPGTRKFLRMQELQLPWTHWFESNLDGGKALLADFHAAHGDKEDYAGIPAALIDQSNPPALQAMIDLLGDSGSQTNSFDSAQIEQEVRSTNRAQPADNTLAGVSQTWNQIFNVASSGAAIKVPYHDVKVTDPTKLQTASENYKGVMAGRVPASQMSDIRDVFPDDTSLLAQIGLRATPGMEASALLRVACGQCHNSTLDQSITRARFNGDVSSLSQGEKNLAIARLHLTADDPKVMPPRRFFHLSPSEIQTLTQLLSQ